MDKITLLVSVLFVQFMKWSMFVHGVQHMGGVFNHFGIVHMSLSIHDAGHLRDATFLEENLRIGIVGTNDFIQGSEHGSESFVGMTASAGCLFCWIGKNSDEFFDRPTTENIAVLRINR